MTTDNHRSWHLIYGDYNIKIQGRWMYKIFSFEYSGLRKKNRFGSSLYSLFLVGVARQWVGRTRIFSVVLAGMH